VVRGPSRATSAATISIAAQMIPNSTPTPAVASTGTTDDLVHLFEREGVGTGVDADALAAIRAELAELAGHPLHSALARVAAGQR
jgi:hypothetical protein